MGPQIWFGSNQLRCLVSGVLLLLLFAISMIHTEDDWVLISFFQNFLRLIQVAGQAVTGYETGMGVISSFDILVYLTVWYIRRYFARYFMQLSRGNKFLPNIEYKIWLLLGACLIVIVFPL